MQMNVSNFHQVKRQIVRGALPHGDRELLELLLNLHTGTHTASPVFILAFEEITRYKVYSQTRTYHCKCTPLYQSVYTTVTFQNTVFHANAGSQLKYGSAVFSIYNIKIVTVTNTEFIDNNASAVYAMVSSLHLQGTIKIVDNTGHTGGAFILRCSSLGQSVLYFNKTMKLYMIDNRAKTYGGAFQRSATSLSLASFKHLTRMIMS